MNSQFHHQLRVRICIWALLFILPLHGLPRSAFAASAQQASTPTPRAASLGQTSLQDSSIIERIRQRNNTLIAGVKYDFPPFGFVDETGKVVGFDVELIDAMAKQWGINVQFVQVTTANRLQALAAGNVDIVAASMTHRQEREEQIDFSQTYFLDGQSLLVRRYSGITNIRDLDGRTVAALQGSSSIDQITRFAEINGISLKILPFQEYTPLIDALLAGQVDAVTADSVALLQSALEHPELAVVGGRFTREPYGLGVPTNDSYFRNLVDFTLQQLKLSGEYDRIYAKWFVDDQPYPLELYAGQWPYTFATSPITKSVTTSRFPLLQQRRQLVVGVKYDQPPFSSLNEEGDLVGFDIDIAREFARRWLGDADAMQPVRVAANSRVPTLASGQVDLVIASMPHLWEDDAQIDFSQTYLIDGQRLLVRKNEQIRSVGDLDGKIVAVVDSSANEEALLTQAKQAGVTVEILPFMEYPSAIAALQAGQVDAVTADGLVLAEFAKQGSSLAVVGDRFTSMPYAIGVPNFDSTLRDIVNITLQAMRQDGVYDALYRKWFGANSMPYPIELWPSGSGITNAPVMPEIPILIDETATATPSKTATATKTATSTPTATATATNTATETATSTPTATATATNMATETPKPTATETATSTPTATATATNTATETPKPTATETPTSTPTATATATNTATETPEPTATETATSTPTATATATNTAAPQTALSKALPTRAAATAAAATATNTPRPTATDTPTPTLTATATATATNTPRPTATDTPTPTLTATATATATNTPRPTATDTPSPTPTETATATATNTPRPTATDTPSPTPTETSTPTATPTTPLLSFNVRQNVGAAPGAQGEPALGYIAVPDYLQVNARASTSLLAEVLQVLDSGEIVAAVARDPNGYWIQTQLEDGRLAWVYSEIIVISQSTYAQLPIVTPPPLAISGEALPTQPAVRPSLAAAPAAPQPTKTPTPALQLPSTSNNSTLPTTYEIKRGDTLWSIADRYYGYGGYWTVIYENNKNSIGPDPAFIAVGDKIVIPALSN